MRAWLAEVDGIGKFVYVDKLQNQARTIRLIIYQILNRDMFDRPTIKLTYLNENELITLPVIELVKAAASRSHNTELIKIA